ncbi:MAG: DsrE family protein [Gemmatimonadota bacterium]
MANTLFVLNDPPYGSERSYNALRLATALVKREAEAVRVFLMGDAASCAKAGQQVPQGYYRLEAMLQVASRQGAQIAACGTCLDARGIVEAELIDGISKGTLEQLTDWTVWAERTLVF